MHVVREPVVVELFQLDPVDLEAPCQSTDFLVPFKYGDPDSVLAKLIRGGQAAKAATDDGDVTWYIS